LCIKQIGGNVGNQIKITFICWALLMSSQIWAQEGDPIWGMEPDCLNVPAGVIINSTDFNEMPRDPNKIDNPIVSYTQTEILFSEGCKQLMIFSRSARQSDADFFLLRATNAANKIIGDTLEIPIPKIEDLQEVPQINSRICNLLHSNEFGEEDDLAIIVMNGYLACFIVELNLPPSSLEDFEGSNATLTEKLISGHLQNPGFRVPFIIQYFPDTEEFEFSVVPGTITGTDEEVSREGGDTPVERLPRCIDAKSDAECRSARRQRPGNGDPSL